MRTCQRCQGQLPDPTDAMRTRPMCDCESQSADATSDQGAAPLVGTGSWLGRVLRAGYEPGDGTADGEQMIDGQWWRPKFGCDSLAEVFEAIEAEARPNGRDDGRAGND